MYISEDVEVKNLDWFKNKILNNSARDSDVIQIL